MKKNDALRVDLAIIKHGEIYDCYKQLNDENAKKYPEVAAYIAKNYYYGVLAKHFDLSPNYICSIICKVLADEKKFYNDLFRAKLNVAETIVESDAV